MDTVWNYFELFIINQVFNTNICEISLQRIAFIQIYHVWEGYLRKIPVERRKISRAEIVRLSNGIFRKYPSQTWYICIKVNGIQVVIFHTHEWKPVQTLLPHCAFSLENERSPAHAQLVTIMHMNIFKCIFKIGEHIFQAIRNYFTVHMLNMYFQITNIYSLA